MNMKKLTEYQKHFLLHVFFSEHTSAIGWLGIATKLLDTGKCIVAGTECIWKGGIGNFIKTKNPEYGVGCLLYTFDLNDLIKSVWYKEIVERYMCDWLNEKQEITNKMTEISFLSNK